MDDLLREVQAEKEHISNTLSALKRIRTRRRKTVVELAAIAVFLHNIYNGMENLLKRILRFKKVHVLNSGTSHKDLLDSAVDHKIITFQLSKRLDEYRAFRHFFVHGYGIMLDERQLKPLAENITKVWKEFDSQINLYIESLK
jgi:uncharacterized protein YutE (UPF0331/DUF86 family)